MNITHDTHDRNLNLPKGDLERLTFCRHLESLIMTRSPLLLALPEPLNEWALHFMTDFISQPRTLLNNQREAIDSLRKTCAGKVTWALEPETFTEANPDSESGHRQTLPGNEGFLNHPPSLAAMAGQADQR